MVDQRCANCAWWRTDHPTIATGTRRPAGADEAIGACTAHAPVAIGLSGMVVSTFPEVHADRVCGDWRPRAAGGPDGGNTIDIKRAA